jgi:hypothetical protein
MIKAAEIVVLVQKQVVYFSPLIMGKKKKSVLCLCGLLCSGDQHLL